MKSSPSVVAVVLCAGSGQRAGLGHNKLLHYVGRQTLLGLTLERLVVQRISRVVLVINPADEAFFATEYPKMSRVHGGATRSDSVRAGLRAVGECDIVVIHDGARPFVTPQIVDASIDSAIKYGSGIVATPTIDSICTSDGATISQHLDRTQLYNIQTPQAFRRAEIVAAYESVAGSFGDDSAVYAGAGFVPRLVMGSPTNTKVTTPSDIWHANVASERIGVGFDVHRLAQGRRLVLGGVAIPFHLGLVGHSDADVLTHAVMDAMLSAAGLADIGVQFADTDPQYLDADSMQLLATVKAMTDQQNLALTHISGVIMAQQPRLATHIPKIERSLASALGLNPSQIKLSATTTEGMGIIGEGAAIAASATVLAKQK